MKKQVMIEPNSDKVYLVTGVMVALDEEDGILITGMLSDIPFKNENQESSSTGNLVASFAFTRRQAKFMRDRLNEFLKEQE